MKIKEIAFTCYPVTDIPRARAFYEGVLGLKPGFLGKPEAEANWVEYEIGPHTLTIGCGGDWKPSRDGGGAALEVEDFDAAVEQLRAAKVPFRNEPWTGPICKMAAVFDPDGNTVVIHQRTV
jgi:catechol 2,3-dioxygenase-like lactoylglutathione lyase family enzyme